MIIFILIIKFCKGKFIIIILEISKILINIY